MLFIIMMEMVRAVVNTLCDT